MRRLAGDGAGRVNAILNEPGMGAALYVDSANNKLLMSYGTFRAQLPSRFCPGSVGEMTLLAYCPPAGSGTEPMVSPFFVGVREQDRIPQIPTKWANVPSKTVHPGDRVGVASVMLVLGLEPEPQPNRAELLQEREPAPPPEPSSTDRKSWWDRFAQR
jgi:hypothetical protein